MRTFFFLVIATSFVLSLEVRVTPDQGIKLALISSQPGDKIWISEGRFTGSENCDLLLSADRVSLMGAGPTKTIIDCRHISRCITIRAVGVAISGISFLNGEAPNTPPETTSSQTLRGLAKERERGRFLPRRIPTAKPKLVTSIGIYIGENGEILFKQTPISKKKTSRKIQRIRNDRYELRAAVSVADSIGGCVFIQKFSTVTLTDIVVTGGRAQLGSGVAAVNSAMNISNSLISKNGIIISFELDLSGAGMYLYNSTVVVSDTEILANFFSSNGGTTGGGIASDANSKIQILGNVSICENSLVTNADKETDGGGLFVQYSSKVEIIGTLLVAENSVKTIGDGAVYGSGMSMYLITRVWISGNISVENNTIFQNGNGPINGGGMYFASVKSLSVDGALSVVGNSASSISSGVLSGAGIFIVDVQTAEFGGRVTVRDNAITCQFPDIQPISDILYSTVESYATPACPDLSQIEVPSGNLSDGSAGDYSPNTQCAWLIKAPTLSQRIFGRFLVTIIYLGIEASSGCNYDSLSLYDGGSDSAPMLGTYCGTLNSTVCGSGTCVSTNSSFYTSSSQLYITFKSDDSVQSSGWAIRWSLYPGASVGDTSGSAGQLWGLRDVSSYASGGGTSILGSTSVVFASAIFSGNTLSHPLYSVGGGLSVSTSKVYIYNSTISNNFLAAQIVGGGGIVSMNQGTYVSLSGSVIKNNRVRARGKCYKIFDDVTRCPLALGGGAAAVYGSLSADNSIFFENSVTCAEGRSNQCRAGGGGLAINLGGSVAISASIFLNNSVECSPMNKTCAFGSGAGFHADASGTVEFLSTKFLSNRVSGVGGGGAVFTASKIVTKFFGVDFMENAAREGGAILITGSSQLICVQANFTRNRGIFIGGALASLGDGKMEIESSVFINNSAPRGSTFIAYNDNEISYFQISNSMILSGLGTTALMLGKNNISNVVWNCNYFGSIYIPDESGTDFLSVTFSRCGEGTYTLDQGSSLLSDRVCLSCPFGGSCLGSQETDNGLLALTGFYGVRGSSADKIIFTTCPPSYCCELSKYNGCPYQYCQGRRVGKMCGRCPPGNGLRFFTENCFPDEECDDMNWAIPLIFLYAFAASLFLVANTNSSDENSGLLAVLLFFYQALPLVKSSWKLSSVAPAISVLQSVFALSPSSGESSSAGVCLVPAMRTTQKIAAKIVTQLLTAAALAVIFPLHFALHKIFFRRRPFTLGLYISTFIRIVSISYTTLVLVPLQLIQCVYIEDEYVWFWDAEIKCYEIWQIGGFIAIGVLVPIPLAIILLLLKWKKNLRASGTAEIPPWKISVVRILTGGFTPRRNWWLGVSLYRRMLLVVASTIILDLNWRSIAVMSLCVVFFGMNLWLRPFKHTVAHKTESLSLLLLSIISASSSPQLSHIQFGSNEIFSHENALEYLQFLFAITPPFAMGIFYFRYRRSRSTVHVMECDHCDNSVEVSCGDTNEKVLFDSEPARPLTSEPSSVNRTRPTTSNPTPITRPVTVEISSYPRTSSKLRSPEPFSLPPPARAHELSTSPRARPFTSANSAERLPISPNRPTTTEPSAIRTPAPALTPTSLPISPQLPLQKNEIFP